MQINNSRSSLVRSRNLRSAKRSRMGKVLRCRTSLSNKTNTSNQTSSTYYNSAVQSKQIAIYERVEKSTAEIQNKVKDMLALGKMSYTDDETGKKTKANDEEKLRSDIKSFISNYNIVHSALDDLGDGANLAFRKSLDNTVSSDAKALAEIGISVSKSGELVLDDDVLKNADMEKVKALFATQNCFADKIGSKMEVIGDSAASSLKTLDKLYGASSTYNKYGTSNPYYNSGYYNNSYSSLGNLMNSGYYNSNYNNAGWYI